MHPALTRAVPGFFSHLRTLAFGLAAGGIASVAAVIALVALIHPARRAPLPDPPALIERIREVARLESLDVAVYKKVAFQPDPTPADSLIGEVARWATYSINPPEGKAIVFADAHLGLDLSRLDADSIRVSGDTVTMALPPLTTSIEIRPGETEVVRSNLDSANTAALLDKARFEIKADVERDAALHAKAEAAAERAIRALFLAAGFHRVDFVGALPPVS